MDIDEEQVIEYRIMNACTMGQLEIINEYLESYDINKFLYNGWTPLLYATSSAQLDVIKYLVNNKADVNKHKDGYTPLMALCSSNKGTIEQRIKCLTILIEAGANVNASNKQRQTPLMYACMSQELKFVIELIKYVKNINAYDNRKQTALMYATIANKPEIVKILIENRADITLTDFNDLTANDIASMKGYDKISSLLNFDEAETIPTYQISKMCNWKDMFPSLININNQTVDFDIFTILHGMGLEQYTYIFQGIKLTEFLTLTENDLYHLGMDIKVHRIQFMECLHKFHRKKWSIQSIGIINKSLPYTLYDGVISLGIVSKQIAIIGSSFQYIKNSLLKANNENIYLTKKQIFNYKQELKRTQKTLNSLKKELVQIKILSKKIQEKNNDIGMPAAYIGPKKYKINWFMFLSITLIIGVYVSKTICIQKLIHH
ncbi:ankyrin repeat, SAM and basic leucine zipper domain-containing protein 1 [Apis cerana]|uniref:Ankyrin repeat, SAM and basic leucine zipper domain-containing protein n=1 Tax=Apis cerana cerana TaxID=94128 RepID=A0A2A3E9Q7_APICC|nr:ankyrin repeat, SAM and basic leucine zipper domain-containing protein 1 [Apis cerana]PBC28458.1 Ankyrin repeat, SAM and basic leucine zipper domain-containing protein [Apis cerana cerana]